MEKMAIWGLLWGINILTECRTREIFERLEYLLTTILTKAEEHFNPGQMAKILLAIKLSAKWHQGDYRLDRETPYIIHPLEVVAILMARGVYDFKLIIATILHDAVEDAKDKDKRHRYRKTILLEFHSTVREIVELVTKGRESWKKALFFRWLLSDRRIHVAWRAKLLKLGDCLANAQTFDIFEQPKRGEKILEVKAQYPEVAKSLARDLHKLIRSGHLPAYPYEHIAYNLMREIEDSLGHYQ